MVEVLRRVAAAEYLSINPRTLDRHADAGLIPRPVRIGGCLGWRKSTLDRWLDELERDAQGETMDGKR